MNLPNKLTILRFILTPIFMLCMMIDFPWHFLIAFVIFLVASITDYYDGRIAREKNLITNFGKFLDPIADKMLTTAAFLGFTALNIGYGVVWITFIVLLREFVVTSVRLAASSNGKVVAANFWGKLKTVSQMIAICATLFLSFVVDTFNFENTHFALIVNICCSVLLWISAVLTLFSGTTYIIDNRKYINPNK